MVGGGSDQRGEQRDEEKDRRVRWRELLSLSDECRQLPLRGLSGADERRQQLGLSRNDLAWIGEFVEIIELADRGHRKGDEIVKERRRKSDGFWGSRQSKGLENGLVRAVGSAHDGLLFRGEVVEERPTAHVREFADLFDREAVQTVFDGQSACVFGQRTARAALALFDPAGFCTVSHKVQLCTIWLRVQFTG